MGGPCPAERSKHASANDFPQIAQAARVRNAEAPIPERFVRESIKPTRHFAGNDVRK
jgi:hypothetical protein